MTGVTGMCLMSDCYNPGRGLRLPGAPPRAADPDTTAGAGHAPQDGGGEDPPGMEQAADSAPGPKWSQELAPQRCGIRALRLYDVAASPAHHALQPRGNTPRTLLKG